MTGDRQEAGMLRFLLLLQILVTRKPPHEAYKPRVSFPHLEFIKKTGMGTIRETLG